LDQIAAAVVKVGTDYDTTVQAELIAGIEKVAADYVSPILKKFAPDWSQLRKNIAGNAASDLGGTAAGAVGGASAGFHAAPFAEDPDKDNIWGRIGAAGFGGALGALNPRRPKASINAPAPVAPTRSTATAPAARKAKEQAYTKAQDAYKQDMAAHTDANEFKLQRAVPHAAFQSGRTALTAAGTGSLLDDAHASITGEKRTDTARNALGLLGAAHGGIRGLSYLTPVYGNAAQGAAMLAAPPITAAASYLLGGGPVGPTGDLAQRVAEIPYLGALKYFGGQEQKERIKATAANPGVKLPSQVFSTDPITNRPKISTANLTRNLQSWAQTQALKPIQDIATKHNINLTRPDGSFDTTAAQKLLSTFLKPVANEVVEDVKAKQIDEFANAASSRGLAATTAATGPDGRPLLKPDGTPLQTFDLEKTKDNLVAKGTELGGAAVDDIVKNKMRAFKKRLGRTGQQVNQFTDPMFNMLGMGQMSPWQRYALLAGGLAGGAGMLMQNPYMMGAGALGMGAGMYPYVGGMANPWLQRQYGFGLPGTNVYTGQLPPTAPPQQ
jgi:hypothetical protein